MSLTAVTVTTTAVSNQPPAFPAAAIVSIAIAGVVIVVFLLLALRKCLIVGGVTCPQCKFDYCQCDCSCIKEIAERIDCAAPDCRACLDHVCPTKQSCSLMCGQIWSCYYCYILADYCKSLSVCPDISALECPDCTCPGCGCRCQVRVPQCSHVACLCFECGRPEN